VGWFSRLFGDKESETPDPPDPRRSGSVILAVGAPGSGKTLKLMRLALYGGYEYRLPVVLQDTNGDLDIYLETVVKGMRDRKDPISIEKADFLKTKVRVIDKSEDLLALFAWYRKKAKDASIRVPQAYFVIDEAGVLRRDRENDGESFWDIAASFRNSGITAFVSGHRIKDVSPVGRQTVRCLIIERSTEGDIEFFGKDIDNREASPPMSNMITYMDGLDQTIKRFELPPINEPIRRIPDEHAILVLPVQPTRVQALRF